MVVELVPDGPDVTVVTEIFDCSRVPEDEARGYRNGNILGRACTGRWNGLTGSHQPASGSSTRLSPRFADRASVA